MSPMASERGSGSIYHSGGSPWILIKYHVVLYFPPKFTSR